MGRTGPMLGSGFDPVARADARMISLLFQHETLIRLGVFAAVFVAMALWEAIAPRRLQRHARRYRWPGNLGVAVLDSLLVRALVPTTAVAVATFAAQRGWGLWPAVHAPGWLAFAGSLVLLDLAIYAQHVVFHAVPLLWRVHRMHHADLELDVTSGARFHPLEIVLSLGIKMIVVVALGAPPVAVLVFEVLLNASSMFNHGNVRLPATVDRALRMLLVTPDMHRIHHSWRASETNSNFGFNLACWDRLFGTYRAEPWDGQLGLTLGLHAFRDARELRLDRMLWQPFRCGSPPVNQEGVDQTPE